FILQNIKVEDTPNCVFWDFDIKSKFNGSWSSRGCSLVNRSESQVICTCNHLTHFAVLMQIGDDTETSAKHQTALEVITYVGCGLSLFGEVLTVIAYLTLLNFKQEQCQIRLNLVISIAIAQILFLAGIDATSLQKVCIFVAASIHYFYLADFAWMLMEGIYLYLMVVKVFNTLVKMRVFYAFSWGTCWVSFSNSLVWTFVAPVLLVCLVNIYFECFFFFYLLLKLQKFQKHSNFLSLLQGLRACVVLLPLLGLTWVFGILSVTDAGLVFQYIFTILNSLQGFFIFVIHVLRSNEFRAAYLRKKQKWQTRNSSFPNSRSARDASSVFSEGHGMSTVQGTTGSPDPLFRRHQVSPMSSDISKTRECCLTPVAID
ncbi:unnamed protein product, partial [Porites lobata]